MVLNFVSAKRKSSTIQNSSLSFNRINFVTLSKCESLFLKAPNKIILSIANYNTQNIFDLNESYILNNHSQQ